MGLGQKIKEAVTPGSKHHRHDVADPMMHPGMAGETATGAGLTREVHHEERIHAEREGGAPLAGGAAGGAGMPMGAGVGEGGVGGAAMGTEMRGTEVCGQQTFTQVEDRPIVKERVERVVEHRPVEKQFVTETRFVGERPVASATGETSLGVTERVIEAAEPGPTCPAPGAPIMSAEGEAIGRVQEGGMGGHEGRHTHEGRHAHEAGAARRSDII
ncbi:hypothetical protein Rsub_11835 [Raphidocelis subcapitata]|uniref:Uncharacterized protein n=1 Tax=Raphidocelis subcapitata TaxID=307507 RepID=A0A2V0PGY3_9CHLO|nr:hypothetical protein Rsub_11835 [Raphidocelis subcapitata]|eukprot:GBF99064.1 hypothetical protein Rsub_11835 [Raphidocelis subcapitata]